MAQKKIKGVKVMDSLVKVEGESFGDLELRIAKPSLNADKTMVVSGNFTELGANIKALVEKYKNTKLTMDNICIAGRFFTD